jgi:hypothetical protein
MDPFQAIQNLYALSTLIYEHLEGVRDNIEDFNNLRRRIDTVRETLDTLRTLPADWQKSFFSSLKHLKITLTECHRQVLRFDSQDRLQTWFYRARSNRKKINELWARLDEAIKDVHFATTAKAALVTERNRLDTLKADLDEMRRAQAQELRAHRDEIMRALDARVTESANLVNGTLMAETDLRLNFQAVRQEIGAACKDSRVRVMEDLDLEIQNMEYGLDFDPNATSEAEEAFTLRYCELTFVEVIGVGSFARVFRGKYGGRDVAIKMPKNDLGDNELHEFRREVQFMSRLNHPNITEFVGACLEGSKACIVLEYMEGASLDKLLTSGTVLTSRDRHLIAQQIARALDYLHTTERTENGNPVFDIWHCDVKSANVLLQKR